MLRGIRGYPLLAGAVPLESFLFDSVARGLDVTSLEGRARMSKLAQIERPLSECGVLLRRGFAVFERTGGEQDVVQFDLAANLLGLGQRSG